MHCQGLLVQKRIENVQEPLKTMPSFPTHETSPFDGFESLHRVVERGADVCEIEVGCQREGGGVLIAFVVGEEDGEEVEGYGEGEVVARPP